MQVPKVKKPVKRNSARLTKDFVRFNERKKENNLAKHVPISHKIRKKLKQIYLNKMVKEFNENNPSTEGYYLKLDQETYLWLRRKARANSTDILGALKHLEACESWGRSNGRAGDGL